MVLLHVPPFLHGLTSTTHSSTSCSHVAPVTFAGQLQGDETIINIYKSMFIVIVNVNAKWENRDWCDPLEKFCHLLRRLETMHAHTIQNG